MDRPPAPARGAWSGRRARRHPPRRGGRTGDSSWRSLASWRPPEAAGAVLQVAQPVRPGKSVAVLLRPNAELADQRAEGAPELAELGHELLGAAHAELHADGVEP